MRGILVLSILSGIVVIVSIGKSTRSSNLLSIIDDRPFNDESSIEGTWQTHWIGKCAVI